MDGSKDELIRVIKLQIKFASELYIHQCKEGWKKSQERREEWENGEAFEDVEEDTKASKEEDEDAYESSFIDDSEIQDDPPSPKPEKKSKKSEKKSKKKKNQRLYTYLKVDSKADDSLLRRQYKKLSREYHPDKNKSAEAGEVMKNITLAYRILINPTYRSHYGKSAKFSS